MQWQRHYALGDLLRPRQSFAFGAVASEEVNGRVVDARLDPPVAKSLACPFAPLGRRGKRNDEIVPRQQVAVIMYSPKFAAEQVDVARRFMLAYVKGLRDYNDAFVKKNAAKRESASVCCDVTRNERFARDGTS